VKQRQKRDSAPRKSAVTPGKTPAERATREMHMVVGREQAEMVRVRRKRNLE